MKKILLLFSAVGMLALTGCNNDDNYDGGYEGRNEIFEIDNVNFIESGDFTVTVPLEPRLLASDIVLVYRLSGADPQGADIWEQIPTTYFLDEGELNFFTDFSVNSVAIYLESTFDPMLRQDFSLNQVFRIAIAPGYFSTTVDTSDYNAVMSALSEKNGGVTIESIN